MAGPSASELIGRLDEAVTLARTAQRERALACSELTEVKGQLREAQIELEVCEGSLRNALLELNVSRELLAYHGLTPVDAGAE